MSFEESLFRKGYLHEPANLGADDEVYDLIVRDDIRTLAHKDDAVGASAYQIEFVGRKSYLTTKGTRGAIVVDQVVALHRVARFSPKQTSGPSL